MNIKQKLALTTLVILGAGRSAQAQTCDKDNGKFQDNCQAYTWQDKKGDGMSTVLEKIPLDIRINEKQWYLLDTDEDGVGDICGLLDPAAKAGDRVPDVDIGDKAKLFGTANDLFLENVYGSKKSNSR